MARLEPLPQSFAATRDALHRVAEEVVAPARKPAQRDRADGHARWVRNAASSSTTAAASRFASTAPRSSSTPTTARRAARSRPSPTPPLLVGEELFPGGLPGDDEDLGVDAGAAGRLAAFYEFADLALAGFKDTLDDEADASSTNLWPEHFDLAFEAGSEDDGKRANYGASPGDETHPEPYLYVGPWSAEVSGEPGTRAGFNGAELGYAELAGADDAAAAALEFFRSRREALEGL